MIFNTEFYNLKLKECLESRTNLELRELGLKLKEFLVNDWKQVLHNLPPVVTKQVTVTSIEESSFERSSFKFITYLASKAINLRDIYSSFETLDHQEGLLLLGKTETDIQIIERSPELIHVRNGNPVKLMCRAECFPKPSYSYYDMHNVRLSSDETMVMDKARFKDSGVYRCVVTQIKSNRQKFQETLYFKVKVEKG